MSAATDARLEAYDPAIALFSRQRHYNTLLLEAMAARWSVAASDIRAIYYLHYHQDVTPKRVAEFLGITTGAMTSLVDRIERAGLAERTAHPSDRRSIVIELTERGQEAVADAMGCYRRAFAEVVSPAEVDMLSGIFERMADAFEANTREVARAR